MVTTEADASKKRCFKSFETDNFYTCEGKECMAWRWVWNITPEGDTQTDKGYCGLAGRP